MRDSLNNNNIIIIIIIITDRVISPRRTCPRLIFFPVDPPGRVQVIYLYYIHIMYAGIFRYSYNLSGGFKMTRTVVEEIFFPPSREGSDVLTRLTIVKRKKWILIRPCGGGGVGRGRGEGDWCYSTPPPMEPVYWPECLCRPMLRNWFAAYMNQYKLLYIV